MGDGGTRRRRRSPAEAEREILAAAERFLRERPLRELTIDEVMAGTGLSRPAFYVYFRDRHDLILRLIGEIGSELFEMADKWLKGGDLRGGVGGGGGVDGASWLCPRGPARCCGPSAMRQSTIPISSGPTTHSCSDSSTRLPNTSGWSN